jgi:transposase
MARLHGRGPRGRRLVSPVPHGRRKTPPLVAGLRHDGIVAPLAIDRPMNGAASRAHVEHIPAPTLAPGGIVAADDLQCRKAPGVRGAVEARGAELRLPPAYSPDLDPIEQAFATPKAPIRAEAPRSVEALWTATAARLGRFTAPGCGNHLANPSTADVETL